jgi:hypothetical protein
MNTIYMQKKIYFILIISLYMNDKKINFIFSVKYVITNNIIDKIKPRCISSSIWHFNLLIYNILYKIIKILSLTPRLFTRLN